MGIGRYSIIFLISDSIESIFGPEQEVSQSESAVLPALLAERNPNNARRSLRQDLPDVQEVDEHGDNQQVDYIPKFLMKVNSSLFARATATQIFMVDLDIEKTKQSKRRHGAHKPKGENEDEKGVKSDRCIPVKDKKVNSKVPIIKPKQSNNNTSETVSRFNQSIGHHADFTKKKSAETNILEINDDFILREDENSETRVKNQQDLLVNAKKMIENLEDNEDRMSISFKSE